MIEGLVDAGVELIESAAPVVRKKSVAGDWLDSGCAEWGVHAVEELEEQDADPEAVRGQAVGLRLRHFDDQVLGAQFGQVVAQLRQAVCGRGQSQGFRAGRFSSTVRNCSALVTVRHAAASGAG